MFTPSFFIFDSILNRTKNLKYPCHYQKPIDLDDFINKLNTTNIFFLASPNTATGNYLLTKDQIETVLKQYEGIFVVDECYYGIGDLTVIDLLDKYPNLIIYRGMTKVMGMGAARLGVAISHPDIIKKLNYHHTDIELDPINSFSLNLLKYTFSQYQILAQNTRQFFSDFIKLLKQEFPSDNFIQNVTTFHFMDISRYQPKSYQIINFMNHHGYLFSDQDLPDDSSIHFPEFIQLTPPPKELWPDYIKTLKQALNNKK